MSELPAELAQIEAAVAAGRGRAALAALNALGMPASAAGGDPVPAAQLLLLRARALLSCEEWAAAGEAADAALEAYAELEDSRGVRLARLCQAQVRLFTGQPRPARFFSAEVLAAASAAGDVEAEALAHYVIGCAARQLEEYEDSRVHLEASRRLWGDLGKDWQAGAALMALGSTYARLGRREEADHCFSVVQEQAEQQGSLEMLARVINQRALLAWIGLDFASARELLLRKLDFEEQQGTVSATTLNNLATVELHGGHFAQARRHALRTLPELVDSPQRGLLADVYSQLALADLYLGDRQSALAHALLARRTAEETALAHGGYVAAILGLIHLANGEIQEAARQWSYRTGSAGNPVEEMTDRQLAGVLRAMVNGTLAGPDLGGAIRATAELWLAELESESPSGVERN